eukprot:451091-Pleurochrysis_carterae.AAC.2
MEACCITAAFKMGISYWPVAVHRRCGFQASLRRRLKRTKERFASMFCCYSRQLLTPTSQWCRFRPRLLFPALGHLFCHHLVRCCLHSSHDGHTSLRSCPLPARLSISLSILQPCRAPACRRRRLRRRLLTLLSSTPLQSVAAFASGRLLLEQAQHLWLPDGPAAHVRIGLRSAPERWPGSRIEALHALNRHCMSRDKQGSVIAREPYVKLDWFTWAGAMGTDKDFLLVVDNIFRYANETVDRNPLTDLYYTDSGRQTFGGFIARPVVGAIFAKVLLEY